jgi:hypothetical protein
LSRENQSTESRKRTADEVENAACAPKSLHENSRPVNSQIEFDLPCNENLPLPILSPISSNSSVTVPKRKCMLVEKSDNRAFCIPEKTSYDLYLIFSDVNQKLSLNVVKELSKELGSENFSTHELEMIVSITRVKLEHIRSVETKLSDDQDMFLRNNLEHVNIKSGLIYHLSLALAIYITKTHLQAAILYAQFTFKSLKNVMKDIGVFMAKDNAALAKSI